MPIKRLSGVEMALLNSILDEVRSVVSVVTLPGICQESRHDHLHKFNEHVPDYLFGAIRADDMQICWLAIFGNLGGSDEEHSAGALDIYVALGEATNFFVVGVAQQVALLGCIC
jgi:hypothetical protein